MYEGLREFLLKTTSVPNQTWILNAFDQMIESGQAGEKEFEEVVATFVKQLRASGKEERSINALFKDLTHLNDPQQAWQMDRAVSAVGGGRDSWCRRHCPSARPTISRASPRIVAR